MADAEQEEDVVPGAMPKGRIKTVSLKKVVPNDWNPNAMSDTAFVKLKNGMAKVLKRNPGQLPPIIVRRHPDLQGKFQIIDGFHRWKAMRDLGEKRINVFVIKVDDKMARILTNTLNYLRGEPNRALYAKGIVDLVGLGWKTEDLAELLPEGVDEIDELLEEADVTVEAFSTLQEEDEENLKKLEERDNEDVWVDLKFTVTTQQAAIIETELARIAAGLKGKNKRGRSLEYAAVLSSQSDLPEDMT